MGSKKKERQAKSIRDQSQIKLEDAKILNERTANANSLNSTGASIFLGAGHSSENVKVPTIKDVINTDLTSKEIFKNNSTAINRNMNQMFSALGITKFSKNDTGN